MKELLLLLAAFGLAYLAYGDYSKRAELEQAKQDIQRLNAAANQARRDPVRLNLVPRSFTPTPPPAWFQERINQGSSLDGARQHRQKDERRDGDRP